MAIRRIVQYPAPRLQQEIQADGFMAKCIQHELDHLDGKIFLDRLSRVKRDRLTGKLRKLSPPWGVVVVYKWPKLGYIYPYK